LKGGSCGAGDEKSSRSHEKKRGAKKKVPHNLGEKPVKKKKRSGLLRNVVSKWQPKVEEKRKGGRMPTNPHEEAKKNRCHRKERGAGWQMKIGG